MENLSPGKVYLVGAGPGDPGLISLKGVRCLQQADFILYDGLVNPLILQHTQARAERTGRTDEAGRRTLHQAEINERLVQEARLGKTVVRLKGGDPYIFGRGSEEAKALAEAGIEFEVVPGITAATAAAEYAGFSLTHRDHASAVCLITGHEDPEKNESALDYQLLARFPGTLVFYMGLHRLPEIAGSLIENGLSAQTPAAVITKASTPAQKVVTDTLEQLPARVQQAELRPPSLIIIGDCVALREQIHWFERKPLFGKRIGITRPAEQTEPQVQQLVDLGAQPVLMPVIEMLPPENWDEVDRVTDQLQDYAWLIFTSVNGVQFFMNRLWERGLDVRRLGQTRLACIGSATAAALEEYHLRADLVPEHYCSEDLAKTILEQQPHGKVLWIRANRGRDILPERLQAAGVELESLTVYRHHDLEQFPDSVCRMLDAGELDWIGISSPSIARQLARLLTPKQRQYLGQQIRIAAISPITAAAAKEANLPVHAVAETYTWAGLFTAIQQAE